MSTAATVPARDMGDPVSLGAALVAGKKVPPDATLLLIQDHREAFGYFAWYEAAPDLPTRLAVARKLSAALRAHMQIEEEILYPAARAATGDESLLDQAGKEHEEARSLVRRVDEALRQRQPPDRAMAELQRLVRQHVSQEEGTLFPALREAGVDLHALGASLVARRIEVLFHLTGRVPEPPRMKESRKMPIARDEAQRLFVAGLRDVHASTRQGREMVERQLARLKNYPQVEARLRQHLDEKNGQLARLEQILDAMGESPSAIKDLAMATMGNVTAMMTAATSDEIHKNSLTMFGLANFNAASYESLLVLGSAAGHVDAVKALQQCLSEERAMAAWLASNLRGLVVMHLQRRSEGLPADR